MAQIGRVALPKQKFGVFAPPSRNLHKLLAAILCVENQFLCVIYCMPILITFEEVLKLKARDLIPVECDICKTITYQSKHSLIRIGYTQPTAKQIFTSKNRFCSNICLSKFNDTKIDVECKECNKKFRKVNSYCKDSPNHFCSHRCSAIYSNKHKTKGFRRSKLELYLENKLPILYPNIKFLFNDRKELGYELDIYLPELKLAFELNGIFHYEPIFGQQKLESMKFNDTQKFALCQQKLISLCIIDTTSLKYFKEQNAKKFLDIIVKIINEKLAPTPSIAEG
jgi:hypothetical protein